MSASPRDPFRTRLRRWFWERLICLDQTWAIRVQFFTYVLMGRGDHPNADETISSIVGRKAVAGRAWALAAERCINWLALRVGDRPNHCRRNIEYDEVGTR